MTCVFEYLQLSGMLEEGGTVRHAGVSGRQTEKVHNSGAEGRPPLGNVLMFSA